MGSITKKRLSPFRNGPKARRPIRLTGYDYFKDHDEMIRVTTPLFRDAQSVTQYGP